MNSDELVWSLTQISETLFELIVGKDPVRLEVICCIVDEALRLIEVESEECLHTDRTLNRLSKFFEETKKAAMILYTNQAWEDLQELATNVIMVKDELCEELSKVAAPLIEL